MHNLQFNDLIWNVQQRDDYFRTDSLSKIVYLLEKIEDQSY
jgi:hypothetical protein